MDQWSAQPSERHTSGRGRGRGAVVGVCSTSLVVQACRFGDGGGGRALAVPLGSWARSQAQRSTTCMLCDNTVSRASHPIGVGMANDAQSSEPGVIAGDGERIEPFASTWRRQHLTVEQRLARGRAARKQAPRSGHGRVGARTRPPGSDRAAGGTGGKAGFRRWCPSATGGCWFRRSPSIGALR